MSNTGVTWNEASALVLRRGPYIIAAGCADPAITAGPFSLHGRFIPLFDSTLPLVTDVNVAPGSRTVLVDLDATPKVGIVAAACRTRETKVAANSIQFTVDGIDQTPGVVCLKIPNAPKSASIDDKSVASDAQEFKDGILRVRFTNAPDARRVSIAW
jgi:hypothetical protein